MFILHFTGKQYNTYGVSSAHDIHHLHLNTNPNLSFSILQFPHSKAQLQRHLRRHHHPLPFRHDAGLLSKRWFLVDDLQLHFQPPKTVLGRLHHTSHTDIPPRPVQGPDVDRLGLLRSRWKRNLQFQTVDEANYILHCQQYCKYVHRRGV